MNMTLNHKEKCLVSIALLALVFVGLFLLLEPLWFRHTQNQEEIAALSVRLSHFQTLAKQRSTLENSYRAMLSAYNENGYLLKSSTRGLAIADLQSLIRKTIDQAGAKLVSTQVIKSSDDEGLTVKIRVKSEGEIQAIKQILEAIETSSVILLMDNVNILRNKQRKRKRFKSQSQLESLQLNFDLTAFKPGGQS